ncbi:hypothetical protein K435DRAFT_270774 [Dendrothele bispora CBS 962.96]|uniref:Uncharacterized protein n=1 Tax=Dendrothele bispora (strain CBS 962.96) TaxID=1314807 RepID=A0A4S8LMG0_DENBC|nr:hypothetical protein K435DRAFT_270774 [Dendrothele bispora CBS 962.96]
MGYDFEGHARASGPRGMPRELVNLPPENWRGVPPPSHRPTREEYNNHSLDIPRERYSSRPYNDYEEGYGPSGPMNPRDVRRQQSSSGHNSYAQSPQPQQRPQDSRRESFDHYRHSNDGQGGQGQRQGQVPPFLGNRLENRGNSDRRGDQEMALAPQLVHSPGPLFVSHGVSAAAAAVTSQEESGGGFTAVSDGAVNQRVVTNGEGPNLTGSSSDRIKGKQGPSSVWESFDSDVYFRLLRRRKFKKPEKM